MLKAVMMNLLGQFQLHKLDELFIIHYFTKISCLKFCLPKSLNFCKPRHILLFTLIQYSAKQANELNIPNEAKECMH